MTFLKSTSNWAWACHYSAQAWFLWGGCHLCFYLSLMFWFSVLMLAALRMAALTPLLSPRTPWELLPDLTSPLFFMFSFSSKSGRFRLLVDWFNLYLTRKSGEDWGVWLADWLGDRAGNGGVPKQQDILLRPGGQPQKLMPIKIALRWSETCFVQCFQPLVMNTTSHSKICHELTINHLGAQRRSWKICHFMNSCAGLVWLFPKNQRFSFLF